MKTPLLFDNIIQRRGWNSIKWDKHPPEVLPMWISDMDFMAPSPVIRKIGEILNHGVFGYPQFEGEVKCKEAIVDWVWTRHGWKILSDSVVLIPGVIPGMNLVASAFTSPGDQILIQPPIYPPFFEVAKNHNLVLLENTLVLTPNGYRIDFDSFSKSMFSKPGLFLLCNPHNPTGRVFSKDELLELAKVCVDQDLIICSDEIHCDMIYPPANHIPIASLSEDIARKTITLMSPSKTFNLAGFCAAFAIIPNPLLRRRFESAKKGLVSWVNLIGQAALETAYREGGGWLFQLMNYLEINKRHITDFSSALPGVRFYQPEGTYLAWLDLRQTGLGSEPAAYLLKNAKIAVNEGLTFGLAGEGFVRLNFGCPLETLKEGLDRIKKGVC